MYYALERSASPKLIDRQFAHMSQDISTYMALFYEKIKTRQNLYL